MSRGSAAAKINLALVVGPRRPDGKHELLTVYQRIALADRVTIERAPELRVTGYGEDTLVARALTELGVATGVPPGFAVTIDKRIPVAAGLGGGSADAAAALRLANGLIDEPLPAEVLSRIAARLGADVPYLLAEGPQLGGGDGTELTPLDLPQDYWILLLLPHAAQKLSTADVYDEFDARSGADGYPGRRAALIEALDAVRRPRDLAALPPNDLASSPLADELRALGAFRADVTGAGPTVYGLFLHGRVARAAERALRPCGRTWLTAPAWYV